MTAFDGPNGLGLARRALEEMAARDIAPTPTNYWVWAMFVAEENPSLKREIEELTASGAAFTNALNEELFDRHFGCGRAARAALETGGQMEQEIVSMISALQAAERDTAAYGRALKGVSGELAGDSPPAALKATVDLLASATHKMQEQSAELERKLSETTKEVDRLRANLKEVREEALTDALTGVANRRRFDDAIDDMFRASRASGVPLSLIMADIDHFKNFNDTWGHQTGDQIIRFVAGVLAQFAGDADLVARYGGEEFAVLLPGAHLSHASGLAERIRDMIERKKLMRKSTNEDLGHITVSFGVSGLRANEQAADLIERADRNLYLSKERGRNRVTIDQKADASGEAA